jgi:hypothetical protein
LGNNYYCILASTGNLPTNATYWYLIPSAAYEIPTPYAEADLFDLHYVQSADVLTIVHPNYAPRELRRLGATTWTLSTILFVSPVAAPAAPTVTANRGRSINISGITNAAIAVITTVADHNLALGDPVEISGVLGMTEANGFWIIHKNTPSTLTAPIHLLVFTQVVEVFNTPISRKTLTTSMSLHLLQQTGLTKVLLVHLGQYSTT